MRTKQKFSTMIAKLIYARKFVLKYPLFGKIKIVSQPKPILNVIVIIKHKIIDG
jgi:hypothetical protein